MRTRLPLLILVLLFLVLALALYFFLGTSVLVAFAGAFVVSVLVTLLLFRLVVVEGHQHLIIRRPGRLQDPLPGADGGRFVLMRAVEKPILVDKRPHRENVKDEKCTTQDGIAVEISYYFIWRVKDPLKFLQNGPALEGTPSVLQNMTTQALMNAVGQTPYVGLFQKRTGIDSKLRRSLQGTAIDSWGLEVVELGLGEIKMPPKIAEAMARQVAIDLTAPNRILELFTTAQALDQMQGMLNSPGELDRAVLLQIMRSLADAIAQRR